MSGGVSADIVGYRASGRHGDLGVVVELRLDQGGDAEVIVVRGGVSNLLLYQVPASRVRSLVRESRTLLLDVELADFIPELRGDGTIELRAAP